MVAFIDLYRGAYGVEPICHELPIAPSTYYRCKQLERETEKSRYYLCGDLVRFRLRGLCRGRIFTLYRWLARTEAHVNRSDTGCTGTGPVVPRQTERCHSSQ